MTPAEPRASEPAAIAGAVRAHLHTFFGGHSVEGTRWNHGPHAGDQPAMSVAVIGPGPRCGQWVYATVGAAAGRADPRLEFFVIAPGRDDRHVELVTMVAWYHRQDRLGLGHTVPIGRPWLPGSACGFVYVSLPYPFGPALERCPTPGGDARVLWLVPITAAERAYKVAHGAEALEQRFEAGPVEYWRPGRPSVVPGPD